MEKEIIRLHQDWIETEISDRYGLIKFCSDDFELSGISEKAVKGKAGFLDWLRDTDDGSVQENIEISNLQVICLNKTGSLKADFKTIVRTRDNKRQIVYG